jgi:hypothetical protein
MFTLWERPELLTQLPNELWVMAVSFILNVNYIYELSIKLQRKFNCCEICFVVKFFVAKPSLLYKHTSKTIISTSRLAKMFLNLKPQKEMTQNMKIFGSTQDIENKFYSRFVDFHKKTKEIRMFKNPFVNGVDIMPVQIQMQLTEMPNSDRRKNAFLEEST